jgi:hypothetical protein
VWDAATGQRRATVPAPAAKSLVGWYNDANLIVADETKDPRRIVVVDFRGKVVRDLADIPASEYGPTNIVMRYTRR